jgi:hypothetical protein
VDKITLPKGSFMGHACARFYTPPYFYPGEAAYGLLWNECARYGCCRLFRISMRSAAPPPNRASEVGSGVDAVSIKECVWLTIDEPGTRDLA